MQTYSPGLQQILLGGVAGKLGHNNIGQGNASKADHLAVDAGDGLGAVDEDLFEKNDQKNND